MRSDKNIIESELLEIQKDFPKDKIIQLKINIKDSIGLSVVEISKKRYAFITSEKNMWIVNQKVIASGENCEVLKGWKLEAKPINNNITINYTPIIVKHIVNNHVENEALTDSELNNAAKKEVEAIKALMDEKAVFITINNSLGNEAVVKDSKTKTSKYIFMKYIPGEQLIDDKGILNHTIAELTLPQKLKLIIEILKKINTMHQKGWIHRDIKGQNLKVHIDEKNISVEFVDYGLAENLKEFSSNKNEPLSPGSPLFIAPEIWEGQLTTKSDIYAACGVCLQVLGVDALKEKHSQREQYKDQKDENFFHKLDSAVPYSYVGIEKILDYDKSLSKEKKSEIIKALMSIFSAMENPEPSHRPSALDCLKFLEACLSKLEKKSFWFWQSNENNFQPFALVPESHSNKVSVTKNKK